MKKTLRNNLNHLIGAGDNKVNMASAGDEEDPAKAKR